MLNLHYLIKKAKGEFGLIFYTDVSLYKRHLFNQVNKKTTMLYILYFDFLNKLQLIPKYPIFFFIFQSFMEITETIRFNSLFVKINNIYCYSLKIGLQFLNSSLLVVFLVRLFFVLKVSILNVVWKSLKTTNSLVYEFN
jgi:hypothetical protein